MKDCFTCLLAATATLPVVLADWQFKSRPDLAPPILNITIPAGPDADKGYIFITANPPPPGAPVASPEQPGAYIFRDNGDLIWSSQGYLAGFAANIQVTRYKGQDVLQSFEGSLDWLHGHGYGHPTFLNQHYEEVGRLRAANHKLISIHEIRIVDEKSTLVEIYDPVAVDLTPYGGRADQQWIADGLFQEIDNESGDLIFEWSALNHISPHDSALPLPGTLPAVATDAAGAWDYFHINSIDKNAAGHYLVSGRHASTVVKINGTDGSIIWRLGGPHSSFPVPAELRFGYQHDARFCFESADGTVERISFFDNSAIHSGHQLDDAAPINSHSSGKLVELDTKTWTVKLVQKFNPPDDLLAPSQGNLQLLARGNAFINWGQAGAVTEFKSTGEPIFHAYIDSLPSGKGVHSYRGFRFPWTGRPTEIPAIVSLRATSGETTIYVSWNGDTETATWRFFAVLASEGEDLAQAEKKLLGSAERTSFETEFSFDAREVEVDGAPAVVFAEALDRHGEVLSWSGIAVTEKAVVPAAGVRRVGAGQRPLGAFAGRYVSGSRFGRVVQQSGEI